MRVVVDYNECESNGRCQAAAPEIFLLDENEDLQVLIENPPEELRAKLELAVSRCPKNALSIVED
jgi:ferredoxin